MPGFLAAPADRDRPHRGDRDPRVPPASSPRGAGSRHRRRRHARPGAVRGRHRVAHRRGRRRPARRRRRGGRDSRPPRPPPSMPPTRATMRPARPGRCPGGAARGRGPRRGRGRRHDPAPRDSRRAAARTAGACGATAPPCCSSWSSRSSPSRCSSRAPTRTPIRAQSPNEVAVVVTPSPTESTRRRRDPAHAPAHTRPHAGARRRADPAADRLADAEAHAQADAAAHASPDRRGPPRRPPGPRRSRPPGPLPSPRPSRPRNRPRSPRPSRPRRRPGAGRGRVRELRGRQHHPVQRRRLVPRDRLQLGLRRRRPARARRIRITPTIADGSVHRDPHRVRPRRPGHRLRERVCPVFLGAPSMRRLLTALLAALPRRGPAPTHRVRRRPDAGRQRRPSTDEDTAVGIVLTATDDSGRRRDRLRDVRSHARRPGLSRVDRLQLCRPRTMRRGVHVHARRRLQRVGRLHVHGDVRRQPSPSLRRSRSRSIRSTTTLRSRSAAT